MKTAICGLLVGIVLIITCEANNDQRNRHAPCKVLLNEIFIFGTKQGFIEIAKFCPGKGKQNYFDGLNGYYLAVVKDTVLTVWKDLESSILQDPLPVSVDPTVLPALPVAQGIAATNIAPLAGPSRQIPEDPSRSLRHHHEDESRSLRHQHEDESRSLRNFQPRHQRSVCVHSTFIQTGYKKIPSNSTTVRNKRAPRKPDNSNPSIKYLIATDVDDIVPGNSDVVIVALLHFRGKKKPVYDLGRLTDKQLAEIGAHAKDVAYLNALPSVEVIEKINSAFKTNLASNILTTVPALLPNMPTNSINKCDYDLDSFNALEAEIALPTRGKLNNCAEKEAQPPVFTPRPNFPYGFAGQTIGQHGQKIIINLVWGLRYYKNNPGFFSKSEREIASKLVNLHEHTVQKIEDKYGKQEIRVMTKRKPYPKPVRDCIDADKKEIINDIIISYYKKKQIPKMEFVKLAFENEIRKRDLEAGHTDPSTLPENLFSCGINTFRKILNDAGYKWGTINKRDGVLYDPRIIRLRGKYLDVIRSNDDLGNHKLPVLYTDETWFDIHSRQKKGWVKKACLSWKEKQDFTFLDSKQSRGPRIIILHIGGENGFIPEMMKVYAVTSNIADDYHSNVHGTAYIDWFKQLMVHLKDRGTHLIVMDNAPYHSIHDAPRLSSRKDVLRKWLEGQKSRRNDIPDLTNLRRSELESIVRKIKQDEPQYIIDHLAEEHGHKIVRLAPYNCDLNPIEYVWSDIKRQLREQNVDQKIDQNVRRAQSIMLTYTKESWQAHIRHVKKLEKTYWEGELEYERALEANPDFEDIAYAEEPELEGETQEHAETQTADTALNCLT